MKYYSFGISNFLEGISSIAFSIIFLYFFALIPEEDFLISPWYFLELCITLLYLSISPFPLAKASSDTYFAFLHLFILGMVLITASSTMS